MYQRNIWNLLCGIDIAEVVRHYLGDKLQHRGRNPDEWIALCPFHSEQRPSFSVTTRKQFYHCFGCGAHGNAIRFVMDWEGLKFWEAVTKISSITGFRVAVGRTNQKRARQRSRDTLRRRNAKHRQAVQNRRETRNSQAKWRATVGRTLRRTKEKGSLPF